ncbi:MAG: Diaminopimelate epimerase [Alphaproteobacteria bacterium MarineAlpha4_Bin2]|nr:MAG: Diaminopimelate epimerase [Alphaproteobacteria bacterium MarineAlpha4_Bin2]
MATINFTKMHGAGNDFVVIDRRDAKTPLSRLQLKSIADRHRGIGCDQIVLIEPAVTGADIRFRFHNADGSEAGACGNGARCAASMVMLGEDRRVLSIETIASFLQADMDPSGRVTIDMGPAKLDWRDIPLAAEHDTLHLPILVGELAAPAAVGMGNPHCVFLVDDAEAIDIESVGSAIECHPLFPERTNVEFLSPMADGRWRMRVWERGVGVTLACGSGVCAAVVTAARRGRLVGQSAEFVVDGGVLSAEWRKNGNVLLSGPVATSFTGVYRGA